MYHLHGLGDDGISGYSMVGLAAQTLGFGIAAEEHGSSFYGNNTTPGLALKTDAILNDEGFERLRGQIAERKGSARAYEGMILEQGMDFARPNMSQVDAQYTETRTQIVQDICRWWRVPPHKVGELSRAHFSNVENLNIDYVNDALTPWVKRLEEEADWKLIGQRAQANYTRIALQALLRGDSAGRAAFYKEMFMIGAFSQNKILELEDMDPIGPEGDEHYIQSQFTTLKKLNAEPSPEAIPSQQDAAMRALNSTVSRLFNAEMTKVGTAKNRYNREEFAGWLDAQNRKASPRRERAFEDIAPVMASAFEVTVYSDVLAEAYLAEERLQLFAIYDGETPDYGRLSAAVMEKL
jgi:Phage portal protein